MNIFKEPNLSDPKWVCPICKKRTISEVTLIRLSSATGSIAKAEQVHVGCIDLSLAIYDVRGTQALVMFLEKKQEFDLSKLLCAPDSCDSELS